MRIYSKRSVKIPTICVIRVLSHLSCQSKSTPLMRYLVFILLVTAQFTHAQTPAPRSIRTYEGAVNDKYPVSLTLTTHDNLVYGTLIYKRSGVPIRVVGTLENGSMLLHEFDTRSGITGIFNGQASAKGYLGSWFSPKTNAKELTFSLTQISRSPAPALPSFDPTGTYAYSFGKEAGAGTIYVQQTTNNQILVMMEANRGAPSYNMAIVEKTTLRLKGNQAVYRSKEYGKCTIKLTFFEGGASVMYVGDDYECGFGNAATVTGNYVKTNSKAPTFPTPY